MQELYRKIYQSAEFHALESRRRRFSWTLAGLTFFLYFSFILVIAFAPQLFAKTLTENTVITWGIPCGLGVIVLSFILTGVYVRRANTEFDAVSRQLIDRLRSSHDQEQA